MLNFSVVLIAKNAENTLFRLGGDLSTFVSLGGEVILVDTGSMDKTVELAQNYGFVVHEVGDKFLTTISQEIANQINEKFVVNPDEKIVVEGSQLFDYAEARNYADSLSSNDMILTTGADETFTTLNIPVLVSLVEGGIEQIEYKYVYSHFANGQPELQFNRDMFFDRRKFHWIGIVHETLVGAGKKEIVIPEILQSDHYQEPHDGRKRYLAGLALSCLQEPQNDRNSHYFGRELYYTKHYHSAIQELQRHAAMNAWSQERAQSLVYVGDCYNMLGNYDAARQSFFQAFSMDSTRREALLRLAWFYYNRVDHQRTACYAEAALAVNGFQRFYMDNEADYQHTPHELLYWAYWYLGDKARSKEHWKKALEYSPTNQKFLSESMFYAN